MGRSLEGSFKHTLFLSDQDPLNSGANLWSCADNCVLGAVCPH